MKTAPTTDLPTKYAIALARSVVESMTNDPDRFRECRSWTDLHGVCDANDFLQKADDATGIDTLDNLELANWAVGVVEDALFGAAHLHQVADGEDTCLWCGGLVCPDCRAPVTYSITEGEGGYRHPEPLCWLYRNQEGTS